VRGWDALAQGIDAINILQKCAENSAKVDRIQYEVRTKRSQLPSASRSEGLGSQAIEAVVKREGNNIVVTGIERFYTDGRFIKDEVVRQVVTPNFLAVGIDGEKAQHSAGIVTVEQVKEQIPGILSSGQFGFELDGYIGDGIRVTDLMLLEPDKVKHSGTSDVNGFACQQIDADTKYGFFSVYIDTSNSHAVRRIVSVRRQGDIQYGGEVYFSHMSPVKTFTETLDNMEFEMLDGVCVPVKGNLQYIREDSDGRIFPGKSEFVRENINLDPVFDKNTFSADFLKGEVVSNLDDNESGIVYIWDGEKPVPAYTMLEGTAFMQGYAGYFRLFSMLAGILMIAYALYRMLIKK